MYDCYLSPSGKVYYGMSHLDIAEGIIAKVYKLTIDTVTTEDEINILLNPERYLEERGWMKYINRNNIGWWIHPCKNPTKAQIDSVLTLSEVDLTKMWNL